MIVGIVMLARGKGEQSVGSYVSFGWQQAKARIGKHWLPLISIVVVVIVLGILQMTIGSYETGMIDPMTGMPETALNGVGVILQIATTIFGVIYGIGMIKLGLAGADDADYGFADMFRHTWKQIWKYVVSAILFSLMMFLPLALIGGIIYLISTINASLTAIV